MQVYYSLLIRAAPVSVLHPRASAHQVTQCSTTPSPATLSTTQSDPVFSLRQPHTVITHTMIKQTTVFANFKFEYFKKLKVKILNLENIKLLFAIQ